MQPALDNCTFALFKQSGGENDVREKKRFQNKVKENRRNNFGEKLLDRTMVSGLKWMCKILIGFMQFLSGSSPSEFRF